MEEKEMRIPRRRYSTTELAEILDYKPRTLRRALAMLRHRLGPRIGQKWSSVQVTMILNFLGEEREIEV